MKSNITLVILVVLVLTCNLAMAKKRKNKNKNAPEGREFSMRSRINENERTEFSLRKKRNATPCDLECIKQRNVCPVTGQVVITCDSELSTCQLKCQWLDHWSADRKWRHQRLDLSQSGQFIYQISNLIWELFEIIKEYFCVKWCLKNEYFKIKHK